VAWCLQTGSADTTDAVMGIIGGITGKIERIAPNPMAVPPPKSSRPMRRRPLPRHRRSVRWGRLETRFSLAKLMMLLTILSTTGAALSYLAQSLGSQQTTDLRFVLFCVISPPAMLVVTSLAYRILKSTAKWRRP
jgi:hypothetical protein